MRTAIRLCCFATLLALSAIVRADAAPDPTPAFDADDRAWWAIQPVRRPQVPTVADRGWSLNDIDRFVFAKLAERGMQPAEPADRAALIRRVTFDLIGLPPPPDEVDAFVADTSADAYEKLVDRLLASPAYGERGARLWLDLVRYADSDGYRQDDHRPDIWRYRDYVVRSFNADKPYDRFVAEQIAGDELAPGDPDAMLATGYLRLGVYEYNQRDAYLQQNAILDDITAVTGDVFLGLSIACARCHDHKFDAILQRDYFRLRAYFEPVLWRDEASPVTAQQLAEHEAKTAAWRAAAGRPLVELESLEAKYHAKAVDKALAYFIEELKKVYRKPAADRSPYEHQLWYLIDRQVRFEVTRIAWSDEDKRKRQELRETVAEHDAIRPPALPGAMTVADVGPVAPPTLIPGDRSERPIEPGVISILDPKPATIAPPPGRSDTTGRRAALARWLSDPANPLVARVMVNRIWQQHFGRGLVATPSELGKLGEKPTHPQLLDWLAAEFVARGWSIKQMHRLIVTSAAYRQSADRQPDDAIARVDPHNTLLWRMNPRRLDAEQVHDAMLAVSGELDAKVGGPTVKSDSPRRALYVRAMRLAPDPLLEAFDAADGLGSTPTRTNTTTATQALLMVNGDWPLGRARALAARLRKAHPNDPAARVDLAYRLTAGRAPDSDEHAAALDFLRGQSDLIADRPAAEPAVGARPMPFRDTQAIVIRDGKADSRVRFGPDAALPDGDLTVEAIVQLDSLYKDAGVRVIASQWSGDNAQPGWSLGVTSEQSKYTPRNLILQLVGDAAGGGMMYEVIPSGLHVQLDRPYYVAVAIDLDDTSPAGVVFYMKDLSDPDAELRVSRVGHTVVRGYRSDAPLVIGGRGGPSTHGWDGLIDEVRLSNRALAANDLLVAADASPAARPDTVGYWRFEAGPGLLADESGAGRTLVPAEPRRSAGGDDALVDLCHLLLSSNAFLYVE